MQIKPCFLLEFHDCTAESTLPSDSVRENRSPCVLLRRALHVRGWGCGRHK